MQTKHVSEKQNNASFMKGTQTSLASNNTSNPLPRCPWPLSFD